MEPWRLEGLATQLECAARGLRNASKELAEPPPSPADSPWDKEDGPVEAETWPPNEPYGRPYHPYKPIQVDGRLDFLEGWRRRAETRLETLEALARNAQAAAAKGPPSSEGEAETGPQGRELLTIPERMERADGWLKDHELRLKALEEEHRLEPRVTHPHPPSSEGEAETGPDLASLDTWRRWVNWEFDPNQPASVEARLRAVETALEMRAQPESPAPPTAPSPTGLCPTCGASVSASRETEPMQEPTT